MTAPKTIKPTYNTKAIPKLMAVLAHPDDESFGMGGTLALYSRRGVETYLVCATRGEAGIVTPEFLVGQNTISSIRESELRCAAEKLGLTGVHFLDYRDSGMPGSPDNGHPNALAAAPIEDVAQKVFLSIQRIQPQVVVTFDPLGGYLHPDHIAIHRATVLAFRHARDDVNSLEQAFRPQKLYFHTFPKGFFSIAVRIFRLMGRDPRKFGRNQDIDLLKLVENGSFPIHAHINYRRVARIKLEASGCHASQLEGGPQANGLVGWIFQWVMNTDRYMRAFPEPIPGYVENDLFSGVL